MEKLVRNIPANLTAMKHKQITALLMQYAHIFAIASGSTDLVVLNYFTHHNYVTQYGLITRKCICLLNHCTS